MISPVISPMISSIHWLWGAPYALPKRAKCALVGSGSTLAGRALGVAIDAHDVVIRVNRLPQPRVARHTRDFGGRTDVWFGKLCRLKPYVNGSKAALTLQSVARVRGPGEAR